MGVPLLLAVGTGPVERVVRSAGHGGGGFGRGDLLDGSMVSLVGAENVPNDGEDENAEGDDPRLETGGKEEQKPG